MEIISQYITGFGSVTWMANDHNDKENNTIGIQLTADFVRLYMIGTSLHNFGPVLLMLKDNCRPDVMFRKVQWKNCVTKINQSIKMMKQKQLFANLFAYRSVTEWYELRNSEKSTTVAIGWILSICAHLLNYGNGMTYHASWWLWARSREAEQTAYPAFENRYTGRPSSGDFFPSSMKTWKL